MSPAHLLYFAVALPWSWGPPIAAPTPISAENAHLVRSVAETAKRADRIRLGPGRGELTLLDWDGPLEVVDDTNFQVLRTLAKGRRPTDFTATPDGKLLSWTEQGQTAYTVEETAGGKTFEIEIGKTPGHAGFSPDGRLLAIGDTFWSPIAHGVGHSEMKIFEGSGRLVRTLEKTGPGALHPVFSPDGKTLAVGNRNDETRLYEAATGKLLHRLEKRMTQEIAFSPDGKVLAAGYVEGDVALWDVATGKLLRSKPSGCEEVYSVDWSPKGDILATSGRDGKIVLWGPGPLTKLKELEAPSWVIQVRFTADGARLLSSSSSDSYAKRDRKIVTWAVPDGDGR